MGPHGCVLLAAKSNEVPQQEMLTKQELAWAASQRFSALASAAMIRDAYAAHLRLVAKHAARRTNKANLNTESKT